jgi:protein SCO1/2
LYQLPLQLTDQAGHRFDWRTLRGKPRVVSMFYTSCPFICPLIVDAGKTIERELSPAEQQRIGIVLVSMDPANDTPAALQEVASKRKLDPQRWTLAAPPPKDVRAMAGVLRIRYRQLADGSFNHSTALVLLDADGRELARTEQVGTVADPAFLAAVHKAAATP